MAKTTPAPEPPYQDIPLAEYGVTEYGAQWLAAVDTLLPATPDNYLTLFRVIGPADDEAEQNKNVALILGANVRTVQRYRRGAQGAGGQTRGQSARARLRVLNAVMPIARRLIIRRFFALSELVGMWMSLDFTYTISDKEHETNRDGGVSSDFMQTTVDAAFLAQYDNAAWAYFREWLEDWGMHGTESQQQSWVERILDSDLPFSYMGKAENPARNATEQQARAFTDGIVLGVVDGLNLGLGYPDDEPDESLDSADWMMRDDLASYDDLSNKRGNTGAA